MADAAVRPIEQRKGPAAKIALAAVETRIDLGFVTMVKLSSPPVRIDVKTRYEYSVLIGASSGDSLSAVASSTVALE